MLHVLSVAEFGNHIHVCGKRRRPLPVEFCCFRGALRRLLEPNQRLEHFRVGVDGVSINHDHELGVGTRAETLIEYFGLFPLGGFFWGLPVRRQGQVQVGGWDRQRTQAEHHDGHDQGRHFVHQFDPPLPHRIGARPVGNELDFPLEHPRAQHPQDGRQQGDGDGYGHGHGEGGRQPHVGEKGDVGNKQGHEGHDHR